MIYLWTSWEISNNLVTLAYNDSTYPTEHPPLREIADEFELNPIKVRKLLITAGVYHSDIADSVLKMYNEKKSVAEIMTLTGFQKHLSIRIFHTQKSLIRWTRSALRLNGAEASGSGGLLLNA